MTQKVYLETIRVFPEDLDRIQNYLEAKNHDDYQGEDNTITYTATFENGFQMDIKCCGCQDEASWTEAVLFNPYGSQLCFTEPSDEYNGEWQLEYKGDTYIVNIVPLES